MSDIDPDAEVFDLPGDPEDEVTLAPLFDIDSLVAEEMKADEESVVVVARAPIFGVEWNLVESGNVVNSFRMANFENDPMAIIEYMCSLIHPDTRMAFRATLSQQKVLKTETLLKIFNAMLEAVNKRPTSPSRAKQRGSKTRRPATS